MQGHSFHLKGLDTLRAIAATSVIVEHIEQMKNRLGFPNAYDAPYFRFTSGHLGVVLFFVLSGYLITLLLLKEKDKHAKVSLKNFYMRRILRVWPLYYLIIVLSLLLMPETPSFWSIILCLTIFPNIAHIVSGGWPGSPQIWSIGVEEQFYLTWPAIVDKLRKILFPALLIFFIGYSLLPHLMQFILVRTGAATSTLDFIDKFFYTTKFNCMALGGILAYAYHKKAIVLKYIYLTPVTVVLFTLPFFLWFTGFHITYFNDEFYAILFGLLILNISTNPRIRINIDRGPVNYLGKISYGLYMYHWLVVSLLTPLFAPVIRSHPITANLLLYITVMLLTTGVSAFSFHLIEKYFLRLKNRLSRI
jgi:peptidoglycan/LPS O-acetylase OafA/YrhL